MAGSKYMSIENRIATCLLLQKLESNKTYSQHIGIQDSSHFSHSAKIDQNEKENLRRQ